jgi:hypothetical protein
LQWISGLNETPKKPLHLLLVTALSLLKQGLGELALLAWSHFFP